MKGFLALAVVVLGLADLRAQEAELAPIVVTGTFELRPGPPVTDLFTQHLQRQLETKRTLEEAVSRAPWYYSRLWNYVPRLESSSVNPSHFFTPSYLTSDYRNTERALQQSRKHSLFPER